MVGTRRCYNHHQARSRSPFVTLHPLQDVYPFSTQLWLVGGPSGLCPARCRLQVNLLQHQHFPQHLPLNFSLYLSFYLSLYFPLFLPLLDPLLGTQLCNFCCCYHHHQLCFQHRPDHYFVGNSYWQEGFERLRKEGWKAVLRYCCRRPWHQRDH